MDHTPAQRFTPRIAVVCLLSAATLSAQNEPGVVAGFGAPPVPPRAHYTIDCSIDPSAGRLRGRQVVRLTNDSGRPLHRLALAWDATAEGSVTVSVGGAPVPLIADPNEPPSAPRLFSLPAALRPNATLEMAVEFEDALTTSGDGERIRLTHWHPRLWWGFSTHDDYDVAVTAPDGYRLATSGRLDPATGRSRATGVRSFGLFLGRGLEVEEAMAGDVLVRCLFTPAGAECARLLRETAVDAIDYYRDHFGFYPQPSLTIIPGMDRPAGGFPVATGMVAIHGQERMADCPEIHWRWITAHEIGHQYWLEHVLSKDPDGFGWLMIGLGILADRGYCRAGGLSAEKHEEMFRRYVDGVRELLDTTVERSAEQMANLRFDYGNVVVHGKGFAIVSALQCMLGPETSERIQRRCLREFGGRRLGSHEFRDLCEVESGQDLGWFFEQWLRSNRYLSYGIAAQECRPEGDRYVTEVAVECLGTLRMPVPVEVRFEDGSAQRAFGSRLLGVSRLHFESAAPLREAVVDPDGELPLVVPPLSMTAAELVRHVAEAAWTGTGGRALELYGKAEETGADDVRTWWKLGMILYDGRYYPEALAAFRRVETSVDETSGLRFGSLVWQGHVLDLAGRREEAVACYRRALQADAGVALKHDQYQMTIDRTWVEQRLAEPFQRK